jgi:aminodeoxyfutalosine deaminase
MRKFSAHRIYPVSSAPIPFGIIETDDNGTLLNIRDTGGQPVEEAGLEFYPGIIIPGMINAHCHLELSHLKGLIPEHTGIAGFVSEVTKIRPTDPQNIQRAASEADRVMYMQGTSAVGDISNNGITLQIKQRSKIFYHTFIEIFGLEKEVAALRFEQALQLAKDYQDAGLPHSITPHAPYSVGTTLWKLLSQDSSHTRRISIHHDESPGERELLDKRTGILADSFRKAGFDLAGIPIEAYDIFQLLEKYLKHSHWLLVHNTLSSPGWAQTNIREGIYWVLCPRSNRYIENRLPDLQGFADFDIKACLGTDSLASNHNLSITEEMKTIQEAVPGLPFEVILKWATINGAQALGMEKELGTMEIGKNPGLVNIPIFDWKNDRLTVDSHSIRLI